MNVLIGSTGLIGSVLREQQRFNYCFNSANIDTASLLHGEISELHLACMPAEKWKANARPLDDFMNIGNIIQNIRHWRPKDVFVYSTIDIYSQTLKYIEDHPEIHGLDYGANRYIFELVIKTAFKDSRITIIRLPALFHAGIKKNILFDLLNDNNVEAINLNSAYQWYDLSRLWQDVQSAEKGHWHQWFPEPIETQEIVNCFFPEMIGRCQWQNRVEYNFGPYSATKEEVMQQLEAFIHAYRN